MNLPYRGRFSALGLGTNGMVDGAAVVKAVFVCTPSPAITSNLAFLHPEAWSPGANHSPKDFLLDRCQGQVENAIDEFDRYGIEVNDLRTVLSRSNYPNDMTYRIKLENFAASRALTFQLADINVGTDTDEGFTGEEYKRMYLQSFTNDELVDVILTRPTVTVPAGTEPRRGNSLHLQFQPVDLHNHLHEFVIPTRNGLVLTRQKQCPSEYEVDVLELCLPNIIDHVTRLPPSMSADGRDFLSTENDAFFVEVSNTRTDMEAVQFLLQRNLLGTSCVVVVRHFETALPTPAGAPSSTKLAPQGRSPPPLEDVLAFVSRDLVVLSADVVPEPNNLVKMVVDEYTKPDSESEEYVKVRERRNGNFERWNMGGERDC